MKKKYYKDNYDKRGKKFFGKRTKTTPGSALEEDRPKDAGFPSPKEDTVDIAFQKKAFKDLAFGSYTVPVNPQGEASEEADPYAIVNRTNVVVDAVYNGQDNTSGSVVPQLADGEGSTFQHVTDCVQETITINYGYCAYENDYHEHGSTEMHYDTKADHKVNRMMADPYNDILETVVSEAFTDLAFFKWKVSPMQHNSSDTNVYSAPSGDGLLDLMFSYQACLQQVLLVPQAYRTIRSLEKHLKDMCYKNGSGVLNDMYGLLKKSATVNAIKGVSETLMYHYVDTEWWHQVNMLISIPCRKSNSMIDPLICLEPRYRYNQYLEVKDANNETLFTSFGAMDSVMNNAQNIISNLSPLKLLYMARKGATHNEVLSWFNEIANKCADLILGMDRFSKYFREMLTAFKRMSKVGITSWKYGQFISIDNIDNTYEPKFNKLVYDIIRSSSTGSRDISYNTRINQWEMCSLWDLFLGLPSYDYKSGGSVLTFSARSASRPSGTPSTITYPALYSIDLDTTYASFLICLTRSNIMYFVKPGNLQLNSSNELRRLKPLKSYDSEYFKAPIIRDIYIDVTTNTSGYFHNATAGSVAQGVQSWALFTAAKLFGYARAAKNQAESQYDDNIETDALCFVDVVIDDQTNAVQTFCRMHSPFRTVRASSNEKIGFAIKKSK